MISNIYIPTLTAVRNFYEDTAFYDFVVNEFPSSISDQLSENIRFVSLEYHHDRIISALLENLLLPDKELIDDMESKDMNFEIGVFHLQLESDRDLTRQHLPEVDFVLKNLHEFYSFISSYHFYLESSSIRMVSRIHTFESDSEADEEVKDLQNYTELFEGYFYRGEIPEKYIDELAKMVLVKRLE